MARGGPQKPRKKGKARQANASVESTKPLPTEDDVRHKLAAPASVCAHSRPTPRLRARTSKSSKPATVFLTATASCCRSFHATCRTGENKARFPRARAAPTNLLLHLPYGYSPKLSVRVPTRRRRPGLGRPLHPASHPTLPPFLVGLLPALWGHSIVVPEVDGTARADLII